MDDPDAIRELERQRRRLDKAATFDIPTLAGGFVTTVTATPPLQSSGGLTPDISFISQLPNLVLASDPVSGTTAPQFRALVAADFSNNLIPLSKLVYGSANYQIPMTSGGSPFAYTQTNLSSLAGAGLTFSSGVFVVGQALLSATHTDTVAASPVRGDLIIANSTPAWTKLPIGTTGKYVRSDGSDPSWQTIASGDISNSTFVTSVSGTTNRITSSGGLTPVIDISASYIGQSSITTLGTVGTGTWQAGVVGPLYGGTGVSNAGTLTNASNTTITGGGTVALGGFTLTVPATGTAALGTGTANQLAYWSGTNTLTSGANLTWNGSGPLTLLTGAAGNIGLIVRAAASPTANLQEWQNNTSVIKLAFTSNFELSFPSTVTSTVGTGDKIWYQDFTTAGLRVQSSSFIVLRPNNGTGIKFSFSAAGMRLNSAIGSPTAYIDLPAGTTAGGTAPLKFTSGTVMTTAEAGAIEFTTDDFFATITTGAARKAFVLDDGARLTSGKSPVATTNGRLIDSILSLSGTAGTLLGDFKLGTAGNGLYIKEGTNATMGVATLVGGTVVVSTTKVTATSRITLTIQSLGTVATPMAIGVTARTAGTSFTITSADATDTSVVGWQIFEPA